MSPQEAYIMVNMLQSTVSSGTLRYAEYTVDGFDRPIAGKTGTTQNWSDAWTVGFTPQITTAVWFGFDEGGHSLGINLSGAVSAAPAWAEYMKNVHQELSVVDFIKPESGLIEVDVCSKSGKLPTGYCTDGTIKEIFLSGAEPRDFCELHKYEFEQKESFKENLKSAILFDTTSNFTLPEMNIPIIDELESTGDTPENGPSESGNPLLD